jgi:hypothetical protein
VLKAEVKNSFVPTKTTQKNQPLMIGYSSVTHDKTLPILQGNLNVYESAESNKHAHQLRVIMTAFIITSTVAVVLGLMILSLIKVGISTSNNPDNF